MHESDNQGPVYCGQLRWSCIFRLYKKNTFLDLRKIKQNRAREKLHKKFAAQHIDRTTK